MSEEQVVKSEKQLSMTPEAIRKREERQRKRLKEEIDARGGESIEETWKRNSKRLLEENPKLYNELQGSHDEIIGLEAEVTEIEKGVGTYTWPYVLGRKRAETVSADTLDPENVFPMPDLCFRDIKADIAANGTLNYQAVEAMRDGEADDCRPAFGARFDGTLESAYRFFGFRLRIGSDVLQRIREALVIYALTSKDTTLDAATVEEAIADCSAYSGFSPHKDQLGKLIREHRHQPEPTLLSQNELIDKTFNDLRNAGMGALSL